MIFPFEMTEKVILRKINISDFEGHVTLLGHFHLLAIQILSGLENQKQTFQSARTPFYMKKILSSLFLALAFCPAFAQFDSDSLPPIAVMDVITWSIGRSFEKEVRRAKFPTGAKIYALPFRCERAGIDTFKTPLGMKISAEISFRFKRLSQKRRLKKLTITVVSPDNENKQLFELMAQNLMPPATMAEESEFWKKVAQGQKADYFMVGKYEIIGDYRAVRVSQVELIKDAFNPKLKDFTEKITLVDSDFEFQDETEKEAFKKMDGLVGDIDGNYAKLVRLAAKGQFANVNILDEKTDKPISIEENLKANHGYQLKVGLLQDAFVYAFYYESHDLTGNKMYMIYPFENGQKNFLKAGNYILPDDENVFSPSPPTSNQAFIKLIASKKKLPLNITTSPEGYKYISPEDCAKLVSGIQKLPSNEIDSNNLIRGVD
jgi:hypothetical protein